MVRHKLVYVYYNRNQYITLDTNLNLLFRANTVDTANTKSLKTVIVKSDNTFTVAEPSRIANQSSYSYNNNLFIHSMLKADNERLDSFMRSSIIDVYDLEKGIYKHSFYVPKYKGNRIKNFIVFNNYFVSISGHYMLLYNCD
jgi:hypothetical protein